MTGPIAPVEHAAEFRARPGDSFDDEGFRIVTGYTTMYAHVGQQAVLWLPGCRFASSMSVRVENDGSLTLLRDGKGDVITFNLAETGFGYGVQVKCSGSLVGHLSFYSDGECGVFCQTAADTGGGVIRFTGLVRGLLLLGSRYLI